MFFISSLEQKSNGVNPFKRKIMGYLTAAIRFLATSTEGHIIHRQSDVYNKTILFQTFAPVSVSKAMDREPKRSPTHSQHNHLSTVSTVFLDVDFEFSCC